MEERPAAINKQPAKFKVDALCDVEVRVVDLLDVVEVVILDGELVAGFQVGIDAVVVVLAQSAAQEAGMGPLVLFKGIVAI